MSRSKNKEIERLKKVTKQMERCGLYHTVHHEKLAELTKPMKRTTVKVDDEKTSKGELNNGG